MYVDCMNVVILNEGNIYWREKAINEYFLFIFFVLGVIPLNPGTSQKDLG
jgi:hypothetical protein